MGRITTTLDLSIGHTLHTLLSIPSLNYTLYTLLRKSLQRPAKQVGRHTKYNVNTLFPLRNRQVLPCFSGLKPLPSPSHKRINTVIYALISFALLFQAVPSKSILNIRNAELCTQKKRNCQTKIHFSMFCHLDPHLNN